jgi:hypothetical protein
MDGKKVVESGKVVKVVRGSVFSLTRGLTARYSSGR